MIWHTHVTFIKLVTNDLAKNPYGFDRIGHSSCYGRAIYIYIWDSSRQNEPSYIYIKCYKIPLRLNSYNCPTVRAIDILSSTL